MDFDVDDDDAHLCGYDRAYVCFDRFSWFAVPPTPRFAAARMPPFTLLGPQFEQRDGIDPACRLAQDKPAGVIARQSCQSSAM
jgi:hypothetical protein